MPVPNLTRTLLTLCGMLFLLAPLARAEPLQVVASMQPLALMLRSVAADQAQVEVLLDPGRSPHDFSLKMSDRRKLAAADLVVWIGPEMEPYMVKMVTAGNTLAMETAVAAAGQNHEPAQHFESPQSNENKSPQLLEDKSPQRNENNSPQRNKNNSPQRNENKSPQRNKNNSPQLFDNKSHQHKENNGAQQHEHTHHQHEHGDDRHIWLDPRAGVAMLQQLGDSLAQLAPQQADFFRARAAAAAAQVQDLLLTRPVTEAGRTYGVAHNAYTGFVEAFGFAAPVVISDSPELAPGARTLALAAAQLQPGDCLMVDINHRRKWVEKFALDHQLRLVELDIMGASQEVSDYSQLLADILVAFLECQ